MAFSRNLTKLSTSHILSLLALVLVVFSGCLSPRPASNSAAGPGPRESRHQARLTSALEGLRFIDGRVRAGGVAKVAEGTSADDALERGQEQWQAGRRLAAVAAFRDAVTAAPAVAEGYEYLGRALSYVGESDKALAAFATALDLEPRRHSARAEMARVLEATGRFAEAVASWRDIVADSPQPDRAHARLAVDLYFLGELEEARLHLAAAEAAATPPPAALRHLLATGQPPAAAVAGAGTAIEIAEAIRVDANGGTAQAAETSIVVSRPGASEAVAAWNDLREAGVNDSWRLGVGVSTDGGATWDDFLLRPPGAAPADFEGDPMTAYDPRTGNFWAGGVGFTPPGSLYVARKAPGAATFEPVVVIEQDNFFDKGWLDAGPAPGNPDSTSLYVAYNLGLQSSTDLGDSWSEIVPLAFGLAYHPRIGPKGELYIAYWDFADGVMLQRSFDGGATFGAPIRIATRMDFWDTQDGSRFPGRFRVAPLAYLAVDRSSGMLYCVYFDTTAMVGGNADVDLFFTRSSDQGATWTTPKIVPGDSGGASDQFFPWLEVDDQGRLHLLFFDTRHTAQPDDIEDGRFDVYYATSFDGGDSWLEARLTPAPFSSAAATWPGFEQFLGDYLGLAVAGDEIMAVYPSTENGDLDILSRRVRLSAEIFADGFESGTTAAWSG